MIRNIHRLPEEVRMHIMSYSMNPQPLFLCHDIHNFHYTLNSLYDLYYRIYIVDFHENEPEDKFWIVNDLLGYMNGYYPMNSGFVERFYEIIRRSFRNNNVSTAQQFIKYLNSNSNVFRQIHIIWGLLTVDERNYFIENAFKPGIDDPIGLLDEEEEEEDWDY